LPHASGPTPPGPHDFDAVVVGAGFAGMAMLHRLRGLGLSVRVLEAAEDVGGAWFWNRYPGARCDVESIQYSFRFSDELQQDWTWSERYASQPELLRYAQHVADRFDMRKDISFGRRVTSATYDERALLWSVTTDDDAMLTARYCIMAAGCLSCPSRPEIEGLQSFAGDIYQTSAWPRDGVDLAGKRIGLIGTGSSGVQATPQLAAQGGRLTVFQRSAAYAVPDHNRGFNAGELDEVKRNYKTLRAHWWNTPRGMDLHPSGISALEVDAAERERMYEEYWARGGVAFQGVFNDVAVNPEANDTINAFFRKKIREVVKDPATAEKLTPKHRFSTKRLCVGSGYYEAFNKPNVDLVDLRENPIARIMPDGVETAKSFIPLDVLVFATGFDAMTGTLLRIDVRGRGGCRLSETWAEGPATYLGVGMAGFPNLFVVAGPGSPSVLANVITAIEQHALWIGNLVAHMEKNRIVAAEPTEAAQAEWRRQCDKSGAHLLLVKGNSWYMGSNIPGKPRVFMPFYGFSDYTAICENVQAAGYEGFVFREAGAKAGHAAAGMRPRRVDA